jgi:beta-lactamase class A
LVICGIILAVTTVLQAETPLESAVLKAVRDAHFEQVVDFGAGNDSHPVKPHTIAQPPNVNVAVIQFDADGNLSGFAYVLLSRDYPDGLIVPLDHKLGLSNVRLLRWDIERSDGGTYSSEDNHQLTVKGWTNNPPLTAADELVPARTDAPYQFMVPYPASLFKSMVAFHVLRMVDAGKLSLDAEYTYVITNAKPEARKIRDWMEPMIAVSDNHCTAALMKMFYDRNEIEPLNREFRELNLGTLQIDSVNPATGLRWKTDRVTMTAWDVARLFWVFDGGPGVMWRDANDKPVTAKLLSDSSRAFLKKLLSEQGFNDALTTANLPGAKRVRAGIPARVAERWIDPTNGHVVVAGEDFGVDVRAANVQAEVVYAHKTGWTFNYAADAGIVTSLPGKPFRHYVVAIIANLGYRYADEEFATRTTFPASDPITPITYTQRIPALGKAIDDAMTRFAAQE